MSDAAALVVVIGAMLTTYWARAGLILLLADRHLPAPVERSLRHVGPAVLTALAVNLAVGGTGELSVETAVVGGMLAAIGVAWWRRNLLWSIAAGMAAIWLLDAVT